MSLKIVVVVVLFFLAVAYARPEQIPITFSEYGQKDPAQYEFTWVVKDDYYNNHYGHQEQRDGIDTLGSYFIFLPDGRTQRVTYKVSGNSGFVAEVTYEGEPTTYPAPQPQPSYNENI